jgi:hypothetical protein
MLVVHVLPTADSSHTQRADATVYPGLRRRVLEQALETTYAILIRDAHVSSSVPREPPGDGGQNLADLAPLHGSAPALPGHADGLKRGASVVIVSILTYLKRSCSAGAVVAGGAGVT